MGVIAGLTGISTGVIGVLVGHIMNKRRNSKISVAADGKEFVVQCGKSIDIADLLALIEGDAASSST